MDNISKIFPNMAAELDEDLGNVRIQPDTQHRSQEDELLEYFGRFNLQGSECTTPISGPEIAVPNLVSSEMDIQLDTENLSNSIVCESDDSTNISNLKFNIIAINERKSQDKATSPISLYTQYPSDWFPKSISKSIQCKGSLEKDKQQSYKSSCSEMNYVASTSRISTPSLGSDKWVSEKEKFLDNISVRDENIFDNITIKDIQKIGTVTVKESFIELPRMGRISKSFHGKSPSRDILDSELTPRRASDNMVNITSTLLNSKPLNLKHMDSSQTEKSKPMRPKFYTQKSQPCPIASKEEFRKSSLSEPQNLRGARFTTTLVDENMFIEGLKSSSITSRPSDEKYKCD